MDWTLEVLQRYGGLLVDNGWRPCGGALGLLALGVLDRQLDARWRPLLRAALLVAVLALGLSLALDRANLVDDAYISLRYAQNLLDGHGLVWNVGERVEGYTNFLWTLMLAGLGLSGIELPLLALAASLVAWLTMLGGTLALARHLMPRGLPVAAMLLALQATSLEFATSGLETSMASAFVVWGAFFLARNRGPRDTALCGLMLILATFTRPDHALFWMAAGLAILLRDLDRDRPLPSLLAARSWWFPASFLPYAVYLGWKLAYYGQILPNTFYAKSADQAYFSQGWITTWTFLLGAGLWLLLPLAWLGLRRLWKEQRALGLFLMLGLGSYHLYVGKVGGDFMYGRFFVVTLPLWLVLAQLSLGRRAWALALLGASVFGQPIVGPEVHRWPRTPIRRPLRPRASAWSGTTHTCA